MDINIIENFIRKQKVAFICSVDEEGFPNVKAMLKPRKIDGMQRFYFSTNTSSMRVKQYRNNPNACIYFYHKGLIKYVGVMLKGKMEVLTKSVLILLSVIYPPDYVNVICINIYMSMNDS
jgi:general stress protein 26